MSDIKVCREIERKDISRAFGGDRDIYTHVRSHDRWSALSGENRYHLLQPKTGIDALDCIQYRFQKVKKSVVKTRPREKTFERKEMLCGP